MKKGGLHQRRTRFVKEYLKEQNATKAAIAAGYSAKTAGAAGSRLLKDVNIQSEINKKNEEVNKNADLSVERIRIELARLCFYDPADYWNPNGTAKAMSEISEDARRAIAGFECAELFEGSGEKRENVGYIKKFKLMDKGRALELAARVQKMLVERVEVTAGDELVARLMAGRKRLANK